MKDLGVLITDVAKFGAHGLSVGSRSKQQAGWILRTFETREPLPQLTLFKALVVPISEYCCQLWSPVAVGKIQELEAVQRSFTSKMDGMSDLNYWERLKALKLYSLERRRERYIVIYVWKIIQGIVPNIDVEPDNVTTTNHIRLGRKCRIPPFPRQASAALKTRIDGSFAVHGPQLFNAIPKEIRNCDGTVLQFKGLLDKFLSRIPDQPSTPHYQQAAAGNSILDHLRQMRGMGPANRGGVST